MVTIIVTSRPSHSFVSSVTANSIAIAYQRSKGTNEWSHDTALYGGSAPFDDF